MRHLSDLDVAGRRAAVAELGQPEFRADQLSRHYFGRLTDSAQDMTDLPAVARRALVDAMLPELLTVIREQSCDQGMTRKTLWRAPDGSLVESVLMRYPARATVCVSSQAGCGMACPFCATGQAGLTRNLSTGEITTQIFNALRALANGQMAGPFGGSQGVVPRGQHRGGSQGVVPLGQHRGGSQGVVPLGQHRGRVSNVVFMGMGEPLANYSAVLAAVRRISEPAPSGFGISQRAITVSTVGLVPAMRKLAAEGLSCRLAVSLHAPDDELRDELVPVNRRWQVAEVLDAAWDYAAATGRRVSIEYAMIKDVNDQAWRADALASLLAGRLVHVNLIPLNPTPGSRWTASDPAVAAEFEARLASRGIPVTVRDTRGREIDGACGQLAASADLPGDARPVAG